MATDFHYIQVLFVIITSDRYDCCNNTNSIDIKFISIVDNFDNEKI